MSQNQSDPLYPMYNVAIHTGLRMSELCGLKWDKIDFQKNFISITRTRDKFGLKDTTKTKSKRFIPMTSSIRSLLLHMFQAANQDDFVFLENRNPIDYGHIYRRFKKAQLKAKMTTLIRFHDLRHTFASHFMMNGGNQYDLQKILGHTDFKMTMRYAHLAPDHFQSSLGYMSIATTEVVPILDLNSKKSRTSETFAM